MKKYITLFMVVCLSLCLVACSKNDDSKQNINPSKEKENVNLYFNATILEINENSILVAPFQGEEVLSSSDKFSISTENIKVPEMKVGTTIRIMYNGEIEETYPAKISNVFAIYLVDENGEVI